MEPCDLPSTKAGFPETHDGPVVRPLAIVQFLQLRRQLPAMYLLLAMNAAAVAYTHLGLAPKLLTQIVPGVLILVCVIRFAQWIAPIDVLKVDHPFASRMLRRTTVFSLILSIGFLVWALSLDQYGGPIEHGHIAVFVAITVMGCIFCLSYLPNAARIVCYIVLGGFLSYCLAQGNTVAIAIAINILLVGVLVLKVGSDSFESFVNLERSRHELQAERHQAVLLGEENARLAQSDMLTQLPNRRYFFAKLEQLLSRSCLEDAFCIGLIDLDRFKPVNDNLGHAQGDRLLQAIGQELASLCDEHTQIARLGGDEFGLILHGSAADLERRIQLISDRIKSPVQLGDAQISVGCSIGMAAYPDAGLTAHALFDRADFALYHAKKHARGSCVQFSADLEHLIRSEQALESALQACDFAQDLALVYQPIVLAGQETMIGVEALARWTSPKLGPVPAEQLFTCAERLGIARSVTLALFDQALSALALLPVHMRLSFNLAAPDITDGETISVLLERLERSGINPERLVFEVIETCLIRDFDVARTALKRLRACGAMIALDDFGTGYSSLSSLHLLPIDIVKIDRTFAARLSSSDGRKFLGAILNLARSLHLECVFEGIETESQALEASLIGCKYLQGYFIAMPTSLDNILESSELQTGKLARKRLA